MKEVQIRRLGRPFYSTKEKGTGLGLMVAYRIVTVLKGELHFESINGQGTTAILQFPFSN